MSEWKIIVVLFESLLISSFYTVKMCQKVSEFYSDIKFYKELA